MSDALVIAIVTAAANAAVTWGVIRTELKVIRAAVNAAHARLDKINAPAAGGAAVPEL